MLSQLVGNCELVSIHAPARGATEDNPILSEAKKFQSTPPRGGRLPKRHKTLL